MANVSASLALLLVVAIFSLPNNVSSTASSTPACPPLWMQFRSQCYRFYGGPKDWASAERHCRQTYHCDGAVNAHLVSIHTDEENDFIYNLWQTTLVEGLDANSFEQHANRANGLWLGLYEKNTNNYYYWSDGSSLDFVRWSSGQPDNSEWFSNAGEGCGHMWKIVENRWNDIPCGHLMPYVCKMPANV